MSLMNRILSHLPLSLTLSLALAASSAQAVSSMTAQVARPVIDLSPKNVSLSMSFNAPEKNFTLQTNFYGDRTTETKPCSDLDGLARIASQKNGDDQIFKFVANQAREDLRKMIGENPASEVRGSVDEAALYYAELMLQTTKQSIAACANPALIPR